MKCSTCGHEYHKERFMNLCPTCYEKLMLSNYCPHCGKTFENEKQLGNHFNQLGTAYFGVVDREYDDDLDKLG